MVETDRQATDDNITRRMRFESSISNTTNTQSEHLIPIGFLQQKLSRERTSILRLHVHCLS
jgi:hypothetical protein